MKVPVAVFAVLCVFASGRATKSAKALKHGVEELSEDVFMTEFRDGLKKPTLVEFYSPTCPHCKNFEQDYNVIATDETAKGLRVTRIDGKAYGNIVQQYGISTYPTIKFFPKGYMSSSGFPGAVFPGERSVENVESWVESIKSKDVQQLTHGSNSFRALRHAPAPGCSVHEA